jgi:ABC-2 type transport system ATP-binding protein
MIAIQTNQLTKRYGDFTAVDHLDLSVKEGEIFGLLGVNGAGKTTTIKMLCCLTKPTSGDAVLLGHSILGDRMPIKREINLSPQETAVAPNLSVEENLRLMAGLYGQSSNEANAHTQEMITRFSLEDNRTRKAKALSGGTQRRLSLAMALITEPRILFLDEPTLGLDVLARRALWDAIRVLKGNVTIILTSHSMEEVEALADRIGIMAHGAMLAEGTSKELEAQTHTHTLEEAFIAIAEAPNEKNIAFFPKKRTGILRDPVNLFFCLGFPLVLLFLFLLINRAIPESAQNTMFEVQNVTPGVAMFGTVFPVVVLRDAPCQRPEQRVPDAAVRLPDASVGLHRRIHTPMRPSGCFRRCSPSPPLPFPGSPSPPIPSLPLWS